eukprot:TRINITY_DN80521_c0_g1_i1.p1 TRINITY_DN80521_c0_g1~~TRINITY_DN80521_c0_g1_i1.p1  ORF type:complete len:314 (+),score=48.24 TRINITY_DN80521_c0_g1_i1:3-944(+)
MLALIKVHDLESTLWRTHLNPAQSIYLGRSCVKSGMLRFVVGIRPLAHRLPATSPATGAFGARFLKTVFRHSKPVSPGLVRRRFKRRQARQGNIPFWQPLLSRLRAKQQRWDPIPYEWYHDLIAHFYKTRRHERVVSLYTGFLRYWKVPKDPEIAFYGAVSARRIGKPGYGLQMLKPVREKTDAMWNIMVACARQVGSGVEAYELVQEMKRKNHPPTMSALMLAMSACEKSQMWPQIEELYRDWMNSETCRTIRPHRNQFKALLSAAIANDNEQRAVEVLREMKGWKMQMPPPVEAVLRNSHFSHLIDAYEQM